MIFDTHKPMFMAQPVTNCNRLKRGTVSFEGKWQNIRQWVEGLRRDGWQETQAASGEPTGFEFTSVEFER